jgi:hypothetical protein
MDKTVLYSKVYKILQTATPLSADCGTLCDKACCQGKEQESGMYLYPGEDKLQAKFSFLKTIPVNFADYQCTLAVCNGECKRVHRPLACRVFPLVPYLSLKNTLTIQMDPRASIICPLARNLSRFELDQLFVIKVREAFRILITDPEVKEFIFWQSRLIDEYRVLKNKFQSISI